MSTEDLPVCKSTIIDILKEMRCKNCRYWEKKEGQKFGKCNSDNYGSDDNQCVSQSGYNIYTGPDFGCIHFAAKGEDK